MAIKIRKVYYPAYHNLVYLLVKTNQPAKAGDVANEAISIFPKNDRMWILSAFAWYKLGDQQNALHSAKIAYELYPTDYSKEIYSRLLNNQPIDNLL